MIQTTINPAKNIIIISPEGVVSGADFESLGETVDAYINENDAIPALVIESETLPRWDSFSTFLKHLGFIKDKHKLVRKIAIVSDGWALSTLPALADHFLSAKVRHFSLKHVAEARTWAAAEDDHPGAFETIEHLPANVIGVKVTGIITGQDYKEFLIPLIEEKLERHDQINILVVIGDEFESYTAQALWDDTKLGFMHLGDFKRVAVVTHFGWIKHTAKLFAPLCRSDIQVFDLDELESAKGWVSS